MARVEFFPPARPPAFEKGTKASHPMGAWVTGQNAHGLWGLPDHQRHVFKINSHPKRTKYANAGYQQDVICLVCREAIPLVDGEFLQILVTRKQVIEVLEHIRETKQKIELAITHLGRWLDQ